MNCNKQAERAGPLFKKAVTIEDIKMLIKILNQKLDVAIKAEFSFSNGDYTNVNTEEMLETKSESYERVKKSKMSADAAEFVPMSHKIGFSCNGEITRSASLMKQLANSYTDRESLESVSYAFTNENNSAGVKLLSEDSREESETAKDDPKDADENQDPSEENHFGNADFEAKNATDSDSCNVDLQPKEIEELKITNERNLKIVSEDPFESADFVDIEITDIDEGKSFQADENENMNSCNDFLDNNEIDSEEEIPQTESFTVDDFMPSDGEQQIFNSDNKNFSALNKNSEENQDLAGRHSVDDFTARSDEDIHISSSFPSNVEEEQKKDVDLQKPFQEDLIAEKYQKKYQKIKTEPEVDMMLGRLNEDVINEKQDRPEEKTESLQNEKEGEEKEGEEENTVAEFRQTSLSDGVEKEEETSEENGESPEKPINQNDDLVKNNLQVQIMEAIRCEINPKERGPCKLFGEMLKEKCRQEISDDDDNTVSNDSIELDIVPETIKCQWNSHLTNRMLAYSLHLKCTELANIYKSWSESSPPILPTKFWSMKKQNSYTMQSIAENISLVCLKCEVVQMKLEAEQQKLKYEEIDKKMQLSFQKESNNSVLQRKLEDAWRKATKTEEMLSHKIWAKRKNWFNIFALFYQKPNVILPRPKTFERVRRPFFSTNRDRSRLFFRRAWRR